ncbi:uncharacterized protein VTP21DRAFT_1763 [Calcarisporiella thermophila]|uniref:uncharacterized protein n=1 Tax=Calcarisporiella thermophila TaxID=911321 RepID=UPI003742D5C5
MDPVQLPQEEVLSLIVGQLASYGYSQLAQLVAEQTGITIDLMPNNKLSEWLYLGKEQYSDYDDDDNRSIEDINGQDYKAEDIESKDNLLDNVADQSIAPKPLPYYQQLYYTQHRGPCRTAAFSRDGRLAATGSADSTIKVLDVGRMKRKSDDNEKPVIRTFYDHTAPIKDVSFHPNGAVLASCSEDMTIKLFDLKKKGTKRSFRHIQESHTPNSIHFHPSGDYLVSGTDDVVARIYDVKTMQCYIPSTSRIDSHQGPINYVRYSHNGATFITASSDGSVKLWDTVSGRCVRTFEHVHKGRPVSSAQISKNGKYVLTAGKDSTVRLWEVATGRSMLEYVGGKHSRESLRVAFTWNEDYVLAGDDSSNSVFCWDARTGVFLKRVQGFNNTVRCIATSPVDGGFLACSEDFRARYFVLSTGPDAGPGGESSVKDT